MDSVARLQTLTRINAQDMLEAMGLERLRRGRALLERIFIPVAGNFARQVAAYDQIVGRNGLSEGAAWILRRHVKSVEVSGREDVPAEGPLLIVSNHPGLADAMALIANLDRRDLKVVVAERPFLRALFHTSRHLIYLKEREENSIGVLRSVASHLRKGGAALIFPGGKIEPDPAVMGGAIESLENWSGSIGVIARLAEEIQIVPAIVSGVLSPAALRHPVTRLRRSQKDRERLGAMLQIIFPAYRNVTVRVAFGTPIVAADLKPANDDARAITRIVIGRTRHLIDNPPSNWQPLQVLDSIRDNAYNGSLS